MKFIHVTDPHLVAPGELVLSLEPLPRNEACLQSINDRESDAELVVITGDLVDRGQLSAYQALRTVLDTLVLPYQLLIGNHDDRNNFLSVFGGAWRDESGFIQGAVETKQGLFVFLDTVLQGKSEGEYCAKRCRWLQQVLSESASQPVYLFMHHPPFDVHIPFLDNIGLESKDAFVDCIDAHDNIRHIFFGHVHRPINGSWRGISFSTLTSTNHQVALNMREVNKDRYSDEAPNYGVVLLDGVSTIVHTFPYMHNKPLSI